MHLNPLWSKDKGQYLSTKQLVKNGKINPTYVKFKENSLSKFEKTFSNISIFKIIIFNDHSCFNHF